jgi:ribosomal protein S12 methylthiotransferase
VNIGFISLGCSKNRVDTEIMMAMVKKAGHRIVSSLEKADAVIINTCGFIEPAKEEAIKTIIETGKLKEHGSLKYLVATGCLSQRYGKELFDEMPELDGVVGISCFHSINEVLSEVVQGKRSIRVTPPSKVFSEKGSRILTTPLGSAYLKITEGCSNRCTYCAIPGIRGSLRSRAEDELVQEVEELTNQGVKEIVLIGQDTAAYGRDLANSSGLPGLLTRLNEIDSLAWIRLMYLHPAHISNELINVLTRVNKVLPYLDIPIQHVSDHVLKRMNRKHDSAYLRAVIHKLRGQIENLVLRTTVMVGFPGEKENDFEELYNFISEVEFEWLGVFEYVPEDNTVAANLPDQVTSEVKSQRYHAIMALQRSITRKKNIQRLNSNQQVLISSQIAKNLYIGRSYFQAPEVDGVTLVKTKNKLTKGEFTEVVLKAVRDYDVIGETTR